MIKSTGFSPDGGTNLLAYKLTLLCAKKHLCKAVFPKILQEKFTRGTRKLQKSSQEMISDRKCLFLKGYLNEKKQALLRFCSQWTRFV